ncbi:MAG: TonB family protein [Terriglobia bacterium]
MKPGIAVALLIASGLFWAPPNSRAAGSPTPNAQPQTAPQRIRLGGAVEAAKIIKKVAPVYPPLAKQARIQGTVRLEATIGKDGSVMDLKPISGHPLLVKSALDAVKQWIYQPTLLNGEPFEVVTEIDINYTLAELPQGGHPITFEDLMNVKRISDPQVSPDGRWVAYVESTVDYDANKKTDVIWIVPTAGGEARRLTMGSDSSSRPRWSPDGKEIAFIYNHNGDSQVWINPVDEWNPRQITSISTGADGVTWSKRGDWLLFTSQVYPDCSDEACNRQHVEEAAKNKVKARVIDELLFRHWTEWRDGKYTHLFAVPAKGGTPRDLTPGAFDSPTFFLGAPDGYDISPDGTEVCYTSNRTGHPAWTTNNDLYLVSTSGGEARNITRDNPGSDASPQYSPDGRYIAYTSQARNGYESDLFRLRVYDRQTGKIKDLTTGFDQWVESFAWASDSDTIFFNAPERGHAPVFKTSVSNPKVEKVLDGTNQELQVMSGGEALVVTRSSLTQPQEIYRVLIPGGVPMQLTHENDNLLGQLEMNPAEFVTTTGALGAQIESLLVKPPGFNPNRKYPAIFLIHGGPQGDWNDSWGYRWNAEMFAARGYVVMMTNFHGSVGYGEKFVEEISGDWGGAPYQDLMAAADQLEGLPYVDKNRIGAAGASFGGYMIDWIAGHTNRFKALVSHDGVYDLSSMYGETEELWFAEWEFKGVPWKNPELFDKWSPSHFAQNFRTPMLIVEGERDFRVPNGQAFQIFTALQRQGVPSKLLYFPDEGHFVLKPQNSELWYKTVLGWLDQYLKP